MDNQVVGMEFEGGTTATFVMTAFTKGAMSRQTRLFGTKGYISGDGSRIEHYAFLTDKTHEIETFTPDGGIVSGHGGGDQSLMKAFLAAVATNDPSKILSGPVESLETHLMGFAAERGRHQNKVVEVV